MNENDNIINELKQNEDFKDYAILARPAKFNELFKYRNFTRVQVRSIIKIKAIDDILGFCGVFEWKDNEALSIDGDSYNKEVEVYGFYEYEKGEIDILVGNDW